MANPTKDQLTINALRERVELLEKEISNKNLIIQDYKEVVVNYILKNLSDKQKTIEALKLENKEVYKQVKIRDHTIGSTLILSAIYLVITLIK
jgi:hypothetical protein